MVTPDQVGERYLTVHHRMFRAVNDEMSGCGLSMARTKVLLRLREQGPVRQSVLAADFGLSGRPMRNVRQMVNRVAKHGYVAEVRRVGDIPRAELDAIIRAADSWRGSQTERGFSMALGRIGTHGDEECVLATATEDGAVHAVLQLVPWGPDGLSLDLMRRDKAAQPGLNDFLIVETIKAASGLGVKRLIRSSKRPVLMRSETMIGLDVAPVAPSARFFPTRSGSIVQRALPFDLAWYIAMSAARIRASMVVP